MFQYRVGANPCMSPGRFRKETLRTRELNELPLGAYEGEVVVITDARPRRKGPSTKISQFDRLGFDTEKQSPCLSADTITRSLSCNWPTPEKVYLFRLTSTGITPEIEGRCFENEDILKIGGSYP